MFEEAEDRSPRGRKPRGLLGRGRLAQGSGVAHTHIHTIYVGSYCSIVSIDVPLVRFNWLHQVLGSGSPKFIGGSTSGHIPSFLDGCKCV